MNALKCWKDVSWSLIFWIFSNLLPNKVSRNIKQGENDLSIVFSNDKLFVFISAASSTEMLKSCVVRFFSPPFFNENYSYLVNSHVLVAIEILLSHSWTIVIRAVLLNNVAVSSNVPVNLEIAKVVYKSVLSTNTSTNLNRLNRINVVICNKWSYFCILYWFWWFLFQLFRLLCVD